jgi:hypothetical protein
MTRRPTVRIGLVAATIAATLLLGGCAGFLVIGFGLQCQAAGGFLDYRDVKDGSGHSTGDTIAFCRFPDGRMIDFDVEDQGTRDLPLAPLPDPDEDSTLSENAS